MKKVGAIFVILIFLSISILILKDAVIKASIERVVSITTGLKLDIGQPKVSIPKTFISIKNATIFNPQGFNDKIMLAMPEIYIDYDFLALLKKRVHLYEVRIGLKEFTIVKNKDGKLNLDYIKDVKQKGEEKTAGKKKKASRGYDLQIDQLKLKMGKVIYKDYSGGLKEPVISEYNINIDSTYKNLKNTNEIIKLIVTKVVMNTVVGNLLDFKKFEGVAADKIEEGKDILKKIATDELQNILKGPF